MKYIIKKVLILCLTLFLISLLTFGAFYIVPGDPALLILGVEASEEKLETLREQLGTNLPLAEQYKNWILGFLQGDFGTSLKYSQPVSKLLEGRLPVTIIMGCMVMAMVLIAGIWLGVYAAKKKDTWIEQLINAYTMLGISIPGFFLSIIVMWIFGLILHFFVPGNYVSYKDNLPEFLRFMFFPAFSLAVPQTAIMVKYIRAAVLNELQADYVRTAKGKGNKARGILYGHVLKNAIVAIVPLVGMMIGEIFSGSIIIEQVYGIPGVGSLLITAVTSRDFPLAQTLVVYVALIIVVTNFLVDIVIQLIDPRIRLSN